MNDPSGTPLSPVPTLLRQLVVDPGRPRLTWYGTDGERVELSGHVLDNWVTKTTNLLVEEMDAGPGTRVAIDLPAHWRTVVWALATWRTGACVVPAAGPGGGPAVDPGSDVTAGGRASGTTGPTTGPVSVAVTTRPATWLGADGAPEVVAVELGALARRFAGDLPPSAIDAASAVMTYGDVLGHVPEADTSSPALEVRTGGPSGGGTRTVTFADLTTWAVDELRHGGAPWVDDVLGGEGRRVLLEPAAGDVQGLLAATLVVLGRGGSLVLVDPASDVDRARVAESERVTDGGA